MGYLTVQKVYPAPLLVHWQGGEKEPWCLATNLLDPRMALQYYRRRVWTQESQGDHKKHGFNPESTMLHDFLKLSRPAVAVAFLYVWLIATGSHTIHLGLRHLVDRHDRRDLSIFQIGLRYIHRRLTNACSFSVLLCSACLIKLSGDENLFISSIALSRVPQACISWE
jgi:hypothetical protein